MDLRFFYFNAWQNKPLITNGYLWNILISKMKIKNTLKDKMTKKYELDPIQSFWNGENTFSCAYFVKLKQKVMSSFKEKVYLFMFK